MENSYSIEGSGTTHQESTSCKTDKCKLGSSYLKVINNKILIELLEDKDQPKSTVFSPRANTMKIGKVIDLGKDVSKDISENDLVVVYVNSINFIDSKTAIVSDRDVIFVNSYPRDGKVQITNQEDFLMTLFTKAKVLKSSDPEILDGDGILYKKGSSLILPDNTEIISNTQIYAKDV